MSEMELTFLPADISGCCGDCETCGKCRAGVTDTAAVKRKIDLRFPKSFNPGGGKKKGYGIAADIGTTTVAIMLWNLETFELTDASAIANPQHIYGADVISRITYGMKGEEQLRTLQRVLIDGINRVIDGFMEKHQIKEEHITEYAAAGNTAMSHMFLGKSVKGLAFAPFKPSFTGSVKCSAKELGLRGNEKASVYIVPGISGHVGGDVTAGIVSCESRKPQLLIDIGTNGEIVLEGKERAVACSAAAGPAFEGSSISRGMRAAKGAIEEVKITEEKVELSVIGDCVPEGICGSGIIDAVSEMIRVGIADKSGRILGREELAERGVSEKLQKHIKDNGMANDFVLYFSEDGGNDVVLTQKDVREVQLAKAAISAGTSLLMKELDITADELAAVSIAGAFGNYLHKESAARLGLIPDVSEEKIQFLGNSAGTGTSMMLLADEYREKAESAAGRTEHIELADRSGFMDEYLAKMTF